jgi:hypothetical protein
MQPQTRILYSLWFAWRSWPREARRKDT